jgi:hypothetical protein
MTDKLQIAVPYYEAPKMLALQIMYWEKLAERIEVYIVDDGSRRYPAREVIRKKGVSFPINIFEVTENIPWNHAGARNLAMSFIQDGWALLTDLDHLVTHAMDYQYLDEDVVYRPVRYHCKPVGGNIRIHPHSDSYVLTKDMFWSIGGYDETFTGYWNGPFEPFRKAMKRQVPMEDTDTVWLSRRSNDTVKDANITEWGREGSEYDIRLNPTMRRKQREAMRSYNPKILQFEWHRVI